MILLLSFRSPRRENLIERSPSCWYRVHCDLRAGSVGAFPSRDRQLHMSTVVIVDDEVLVRTGIKASLDPNACDIVLAGDFGDAESALEYIRSHDVDIVITDIVMPGMSGLELMRHVRDEKPEVRFVVLTSYSEFDYAREALRLGADEYILKFDMSAHELTRTICDVQHRQHEASVAEHSSHSLGAQPEVGPPGDRAYRVLEVRVANHALLPAERRIDDSPYIQQGLSDVIAAVFGPDQAADVGYAYPATFRVYLSQPPADDSGSALQADVERIAEQARRVRDNVRLYFNLEVSIAVGPLLPAGASASDVAPELTQAWQIAFYHEPGSVVALTDGTPQRFPLLTDYYFPVQKELVSAIELGDLTAAGAHMRAVFEHARMTHCEVQSVREVATNMLLQLERYCVANQQRMRVCLNRQLILYIIQQADVVSSIESVLADALEDVLTHVGAQTGRMNPRVRRVIEYIDEHVSESVGLGDIARELNVSLAYLSRLFRQETGMTFQEYLTDRRMERARELLSSAEELYMYEVAARCGYDTFGHFARVFKRRYGLTPTDLRRRIQRGNA